jgi:hypothetical protein
MLGNRKLVLDTFCEVYDLLKPWADSEFWELSDHAILPGAIYLIGRQQFEKNVTVIREVVDHATILLSNPAEGSETLLKQCQSLGIVDLVHQGRILLIGGGDMEAHWNCLQYDSFLPKLLDYDQNIQAMQSTDLIYQQLDKPYKFLFLNGVYRTHRRWLLDAWRHSGVLDQSLWTCLDRQLGTVQMLPPEYEYVDYVDQISVPTNSKFIKNHLFKNTWGEVYINPRAYVDTYFSVVTETVFDYPYSFRTEKIWKPIAIGQPFIAVANAGYYRDLHNLGFQTFGHVIDESFDKIEDNQLRLTRITDVVTELCQQDLASFLKECYTVCKYNQQHLAEMRLQVRREFPNRFAQFIRKHRFDE